MGSAGRVPHPAPLGKGAGPPAAEQKPKALAATSLAEIYSDFRGKKKVLGLRHGLAALLAQHGLCRVEQLLRALPDVKQGQGCCTQLCTLPRATYQKACTTHKWLYASQAAPASQLDKN